KLQEKIAPINVKPGVFLKRKKQRRFRSERCFDRTVFRHGLFGKRNWITRKIPGVTVVVDDYLNDGGAQSVIDAVNRLTSRSHLRVRIAEQRVNRAINRLRID